MLSFCSLISFKVANVELWCRWEISKLEVEICVDLPQKRWLNLNLYVREENILR